MRPLVRKSKKGTSLVEIMIAVLISSIVMLGGSFFFVASTGQINLREQYRAASRLASQKLEEVKAVDYDTVVEGDIQDSVTLRSASYNRNVAIKDLGSMKEITVTVNWGTEDKQQSINMVTFIAPK